VVFVYSTDDNTPLQKVPVGLCFLFSGEEGLGFFFFNLSTSFNKQNKCLKLLAVIFSLLEQFFISFYTCLEVEFLKSFIPTHLIKGY